MTGLTLVPASPARVLAWLARSGLVDAATACRGRVELHDASCSNPVFVVSVDGAPQRVVKQAGPMIDGGSSVEAEVAAYRWLQTEPALVDIAPHAVALPQGTDSHWLVLDIVSDARPMLELMANVNGNAPFLVSELARLLGRLHTISAETRRGKFELPARRPWLLDLASEGQPDFVAANPGARAAVADLASSGNLMTLLRDLGKVWRPRAAIHGDVKWDNVFVRREHGSYRLWLIDWELAAWGDPLWDLASLVEGLLTMSVIGTGTADVTAVAPLSRSAVAAYGTTALATERLMQFVAARLLQVTVQLGGMAVEPDDSLATRHQLLDLATSIAGDPALWAEGLCRANKDR